MTRSIEALVRRQFLVTAAVMLAVCLGLGTLAVLLYQTRAIWEEYAGLRSPRVHTAELLVHHLGYGGLVHNYYNAVLRPDERYQQAVFADIGVTRALVDEYKALSGLAIERAALQIITENLHAIETDMHRLPVRQDAAAGPAAFLRSSNASFSEMTEAMQYLTAMAAGDTGQGADRSQLSLLESELGLGGMIHNLKLFVITRDQVYADAASRSADNALDTIGRISGQLSGTSEKTSLAIVRRTVEQYGRMIELAGRLAAEGQQPAAIDRTIRVDDKPALTALWTLANNKQARVVAARADLEDRIAPGQYVVLAAVAFLLFLFAVHVAFGGLGLARRLSRWSSRLAGTMERVAASPVHVTMPDGATDPGSPVDRMLSMVEETLVRQQEVLEDKDAELARVRREAEETGIRNATISDELDRVLTEREDADETRARAERASDRLDSILSALPNGVLATTASGRFLFWNDNMPEILGVPPGWFDKDRTLWDLTLYGATRGDYGAGDPWEIAKNVHSRLDRGMKDGVVHYEVHVSDGRVVELGVVREPNGDRVFTATDITERHTLLRKLEEQAASDSLTGLPNRRSHDAFLSEMLQHARRGGDLVARLSIDLDDFHRINETHGPAAGDRALIEVARRLSEQIRDTDMAARMEHDAFAVVLTHLDEPAGAERFARRLLHALEEPMDLLPCESAAITASVGIALYPTHAGAPDVIVRRSDEAMQAAKDAGKDMIRICEVDLRAAPSIVSRGERA